MKQPVTERIGEAGVRDVVVPLAGRELAGDDRGAGARAVLENLEQIAATVFRERAQGEVIEDEDVDAGEAGELLGIRIVDHVVIGDGRYIGTRLVPSCRDASGPLANNSSTAASLGPGILLAFEVAAVLALM